MFVIPSQKSKISLKGGKHILTSSGTMQSYTGVSITKTKVLRPRKLIDELSLTLFDHLIPTRRADLKYPPVHQNAKFSRF